MTGYVVLAVLAATAALSYIASGRDVLDPGFVVAALFAASLATALANAETWDFSLQSAAASAVVLGVLALAYGAVAGRAAARSARPVALRRSRALPTGEVQGQERKEGPGLAVVAVLAALSLVVAALTYRRMLQLASSAGYSGNNVLWYVHRALDEGGSWGFGLALVQYCIFGTTYVLAALAIVQLADPARRFKLRCFALVPGFVAIQVMSAGRTGLAQFAVFCAVVSVLALRRFRGREVRALPALALAAGGLLAFAGAFFAIGQLSGKSDLYESPLQNLSVYAGTSIPALNAFFGQGVPLASDPPGFNTFAGTYALLSRLGFPVPVAGTHDAAFVVFDGYRINTYTYLKALYLDYGFAGIAVVSFVIGAVFAFAAQRMRQRREFRLADVLYAYFFYYEVLLVVGAGLTNALLSVNQLLTLAFMAAAYRVLWPSARGLRQADSRRKQAAIPSLSRRLSDERRSGAAHARFTMGRGARP